MDKEFSCSDHNYLLKSDNCKYIFHLLNGDMSYLKNGFTGSVLKNISKSYLLNLEIPVPKRKEKIQEWVDKISKPYNEKNEKQTRVKKLEIDIKNRIKEITENEECDEVELGSICKIMTGKNLPKDKIVLGVYNVYGGGSSSYMHNTYNFEGFNTIISRVGNNGVTLVNGKIYLTDNGFSLVPNDYSIKKYFGYYILNNKDRISDVGNGSAQKVISKTQLSQLRVKIPKNKQLINSMDCVFQEVESLHMEIRTAEELYKQYIQELGNESKTRNVIAIIEESNVVINEQVQEPIIKIRKIKKKNTV